MKQGWEIKKLGEVCDIICGLDYKSVQDANGQYPIYGTGGIMGYASKYRCPANSVIIGRKGNINNPIFVDKCFWNVDTAFGVVPNSELLYPKFFYLFCKDYDFTKHDVSVTIPSLRRTDILQILVPIPPLAEQERIVAELDCLSGIIEKKKQQLKELDALAQSIFYTMFGDPITNEKGWEVKKVKDIFNVKIGPFGSLLHNSDYISGGTPLVNPIHMQNEKICPDFNFSISDDKLKELDSYLLQTNDIIFARRGDIGRCAIVGKDENGYLCGTGSLFIRPTQSVCPVFMLKSFRCESMIEYLTSLAKGATMLNINCKIIEELNIVMPPLALQQQFASKIEAIEKQKELIKQSIKETETLFNSRMNYYFN
ncbi:MAG: restriction endonuclease subunit S [Bacteroidaceae bacterium]|nr:restriction endonuclease subunit S [Bacteroidaceae bacterium]